MIYITALVFFAYPVIAMPLILYGLIFDVKHRKFYGILLAFLLGIFAYHFKPENYNLDLNVYRVQMRYYGSFDWSEIVKEMLTNKESLTTFVFYLIEKIGNYSIWQFFVPFIGYSILFYMLSDFAQIRKINCICFLSILTGTIILFNNFLLMTGLRNSLSILIFALAIYFEYIKHKRGIFYKLLYMIPVFIHVSMIVGILIRLFMSFPYKKSKNVLLIGLICYAFLPNLMIQVALKISFIPIISGIASKAMSYLSDTQSIFNNFYYLMKVVILVNFFIIFKKMKKRDGENKAIGQFYDIVEIILLFTIASYPYFQICTRWIDLCVILMSIIIIQNINYFLKMNVIYKLILIVGISFCIIQQINSFSKVNYIQRYFFKLVQK